MKTSKRRFSKPFKEEAVALYEHSEKSAREIETELGLSRGQLLRWRRQIRQAGAQAFPGTGHQTEVDAELRRLRREVALLKEDREI